MKDKTILEGSLELEMKENKVKDVEAKMLREKEAVKGKGK